MTNSRECRKLCTGSCVGPTASAREAKAGITDFESEQMHPDLPIQLDPVASFRCNDHTRGNKIMREYIVK